MDPGLLSCWIHWVMHEAVPQRLNHYFMMTFIDCFLPPLLVPHISNAFDLTSTVTSRQRAFTSFD